MSEQSGSFHAPRAARRAIESSFSRLYRATFGGSPPASNPRAVDLLWNASGGRLGTIRSRMALIVRGAAARGYRIDLGVVWTRWSETRGRAA